MGKIKNKILSVLLTALLVGLSILPFASGSTVIYTEDFESELGEEWELEGTCNLDSEVYHAGASSLYISGSDGIATFAGSFESQIWTLSLFWYSDLANAPGLAILAGDASISIRLNSGNLEISYSFNAEWVLLCPYVTESWVNFDIDYSTGLLTVSVDNEALNTVEHIFSSSLFTVIFYGFADSAWIDDFTLTDNTPIPTPPPTQGELNLAVVKTIMLLGFGIAFIVDMRKPNKEVFDIVFSILMLGGMIGGIVWLFA